MFLRNNALQNHWLGLNLIGQIQSFADVPINRCITLHRRRLPLALSQPAVCPARARILSCCFPKGTVSSFLLETQMALS